MLHRTHSDDICIWRESVEPSRFHMDHIFISLSYVDQPHGIGSIQGFHEPIKIIVQAKMSGINTLQGTSNPPTVITTTKPETYLLSSHLATPSAMLFAFSFLWGFRPPARCHSAPRTQCTAISLRLRLYLVFPVARPMSPLCLRHPHHTSTNHTGLLHTQICIEKGPWKDGTSAWKELIGGTHCLQHEDMHFLIFLWAFVMCWHHGGYGLP